MKKLVNIISNKFYLLLLLIIKFYQKLISPLLPARCRYYPTCSDYGKQALAWHGVRSGGWLLLKRLSRCQPWGGHGIDFVPIPLNRYYYKLVPINNNLNIALQVESSKSSRWGKGSYSSVYRDNSSYVARLNHLMR